MSKKVIKMKVLGVEVVVDSESVEFVNPDYDKPFSKTFIRNIARIRYKEGVYINE